MSSNELGNTVAEWNYRALVVGALVLIIILLTVIAFYK